MTMGKTKHFVWDYSERTDILNIRKSNKKIEGSAEIGDFTVDFDKQGNIIGIEIMNAADFLCQSGISKTDLAELKEAELNISHKNNNLTFIWIILKLPNNVEKKIPFPAPVVNEEPTAMMAEA